jgi:hypothetical protein
LTPFASDIDSIITSFDRRYRNKKVLNIAISLVIIALGISSVVCIFRFDGEGLMTLRWMTVDGTLFTVIMTSFFVAVNLIEIVKKTEMTKRAVYFARLSSAVAESVIFTCVMISRLPVFTEHLHIMRYDMFCMHILIPFLTIASFAVNDSPVGKLKPSKALYGTLFVTAYAITLLFLICSGVLTGDMIPYFILDPERFSAAVIMGSFAAVYTLAYLCSVLLSAINRKLYWNWFKGIAYLKM